MSNLRNLSSFTLIVIFVCLSLIGGVLVPLLPVKLAPSRTLPGLTVSFSMPGNSSRVIEAEVTSKLEAMMARVKGIRKVNSTSDNGRGSITLELDKHADIDATRFEVSTLIRQTWPQLPEGVSYPQISTRRSDDKAARPFITYTLNAPANPILIQRYAEENIKPVLGQLKGIYKVELNGATPMEWQLEYDSEQLSRLGITLSAVQQAINRHYEKEFLGVCSIEKGAGGKEWIRLVRTSTEKEMEFAPGAIQLQAEDGTMVTLEKLIKVKHVEERPQSYYRINGLNSIYLYVTAEETANQLKLSDEVKRLMGGLQQKMPAGYEVHIGYDATEYIQKELDKIYFRTGLTVLILLLFVALITRNLRYLFLIVTSLVVNISVAVIFYYTFGLEMQLYSLAGITISLNLVIDNTIVMTDHILHRRNLKAFVSVLAATLTTIGALVIIFFLDEKIRLNLQDFAAVVIINLAVSLFVALFFVPSLIDKIGLEKKKRKKKGATRFLGAVLPQRLCPRPTWVKRLAVYFTRFYQGLIYYLCRFRVMACLLLLLGFGLPVFMLPEKIEGEGKWAEYYNKVFDNSTYKDKVRPVVNKALGGSLRLFAEKVYEGSYFNRDEGEVVLSAYATLPNGSTLEQMNVLIKKMETYLSDFKEIRQFQTYVYNARQANIQIYFTKENQRSGFPYTLKAGIISKALTLGGGSWSVYGLQDQGFSNDVRESAGSFRVKLYGYNYDELSYWAEQLKEKLLLHRRIKEVTVNSEFSWWKDDYSEFYLDLDRQRMAKEHITATQLFTALRPIFGRDIYCGNVLFDNQTEQLKLSSLQGQLYDVWGLVNIPFVVNGHSYKLADFATVQKGQSPQKVAKENQQYRLCLQYEYIGSSEQGKKLLKKDLEEFNKVLPMGYTAENDQDYWSWNKKDNKQYALLLIVIAIIFFTTSILFNSLKQPLAIIFVIPISYIGVFLTFYLFGLNFDQGGFASFVLLCGITVNASIYILNEYNAIRKRYPLLLPVRAFTKAWNSKILPIFLTVVSTILGFIPFMVGDGKEAFWFPLAAGTIGGLVMSILGIFLFLPIFSLKKQKR
ncbi:efflux RND transporter permease subunit [Phocaeicola sartorii]|uniref:efflux RND transporter permease subunit n=1 Tax=Phocaeicola sartorii TaxID=671267 RepID=UPI00136471DC|nr:efflux RND transporter permease subunit [Phocaeicola sartorii]NBH64940.1 efflux RND transporter permease subunit [Phocaeicola sartorii]